jgi:hypothetical protein
VIPVEKKQEMLRNVLNNIGILFVLVGSTAVKEGSLAFFLAGIALLAIQTLDLRSVQPKKVLMAVILLSSSVCVAAIIQLVMVKIFRAPQFFTVIIALGAFLILLEAVREQSEQ